MVVATQLVVIYATRSKILRRKIIPDNDAQLAVHRAGPGESRLLLPLSEAYDDAACCAAIAAASGYPPPSARCAIIDGDGNVIGVCNADPELDRHPAGLLVAHDIARAGDRWEDGVFTRRYAVVSSTTNRVTAIVHLPLGGFVPPSDGLLLEAGNRQVGDAIRPKAFVRTQP